MLFKRRENAISFRNLKTLTIAGAGDKLCLGQHVGALQVEYRSEVLSKDRGILLVSV